MSRQVDELGWLPPGRRLERSHGNGLFKVVVESYGFKVGTLAIGPELQSDPTGTISPSWRASMANLVSFAPSKRAKACSVYGGTGRI